MIERKLTPFEVVLLVVGLAAAFLGFQLINKVYTSQTELNWLMVIAIFNWLTLLVLFISLSLEVDNSKKTLEQMKKLTEYFEKKKK
ncbi:hypothetical protein J4212_03060 [Candidatus Woesearchaeota archaeon]|nr:hypothetical protein [Candidatus Woesearchaeota archaeon]